jgi:hypothetical protein
MTAPLQLRARSLIAVSTAEATTSTSRCWARRLCHWVGFSNYLTTGDGLLNIAANKQGQFEALCLLLGTKAMAGRELFHDGLMPRPYDGCTVLLERYAEIASMIEKRYHRASVPRQ